MEIQKNHRTRNIILFAILLIVIVGGIALVIYEFTKTCGDCGNTNSRNTSINTSNTVQLDEKDNGKTFTIVQGWKVSIVLNNTYWKFQPIADATVLQRLTDPVYKPVSLDKTIPGSGAGTVTAVFQSATPGTSTISATRTICGEALLCRPDQQNYTVTIKVAKSLTNNNYPNYTLEYSSSNGSLPPPYHQNRILTISEDALGKMKGVLEIKDYTKTLETRDVSVSSDQFTTLMNAGLKVSTNQSEDLSGCTGGSSKSLTISQNGKTILDASSYSCANKTSNPSLEKFADTISGLLPNNT